MLRDYQGDLDTRIEYAWATDKRNVLATMATGGGKGVVIGHSIAKDERPGVVMAHRSPLVSQLALTLNRERVPHGIIAPNELINAIIKLEVDEHGKSFYRAGAPVRVGSAQTIAGRDPKDRWYNQVEKVIVDEGHHVTKGGIWENAINRFPNYTRGLFATAHACRADGLGLGRNSDGLADALVVGPHARLLIDRGYLCDYMVVCPPTDIDISDIPIGASGDLVQKTLRERIHASKMLVGSIVKEYLKRAPGKLGLTFCVDKEEADKTAKAFRAAGVPCEIITDDTSIAARSSIMKRFRARQLLQLISVDVLGEGVDVPAVEVVSFGRHTESWQVYGQQTGRGTRPMIDNPAVWAAWDRYSDADRRAWIAHSPKPFFLIIDHVDNVKRHYLRRGLFDSEQVYTLDRRSAREKNRDDAIPLRTCLNEECFKPYSAILLRCPYCGAMKPAPISRGSPAAVEGDLEELNFEVLAMMRGEIKRIDSAVEVPNYMNAKAVSGLKRMHFERQMAQGPLRKAIALWAGWQQQTAKLEDRSIHRLFWYRFGIDIGTAQTLGATAAGELASKIWAELERHNVREVA